MSLPKTFCALPWLGLATSPSGTIRVCCNSTPGKNYILDDQGQKFSLASQEDYEAVWNSSYMRNLRLKMLNGERPAICERCFREEDAGLKSARMGWNEHYEECISQVVSTTDENGRVPMGIRYVDLRMGNICNLRCRMCNPYASNQWVEEWNLLAEKTLDKSEQKRLNRIDWFESERFWQLFLKNMIHVDQIYFTGGEPTLSLKHVFFLKELIKRNRAEKMTLKYNTNVTHLPEELMSCWMHFKRVRVNASVDAVGPLNEYIRYPSKWPKVLQNLKVLDNLATKNQHIHVSIHTTVQMYNVLYLADILEYFSSTFKSIRPLPFANILDHPEYLNIRVLPPHLKQKATERILSWLEKNKELRNFPDMSDHYDKWLGVTEYLKEDWSHLLPQFIHKTKRLDISRGEDVQMAAPALKGLFTNCPARNDMSSHSEFI